MLKMLITYVKVRENGIKWDFSYYLCNTIINKQKVMKVLAIFKDLMHNYAYFFRFKNEEEVFDWWSSVPCSEEFKLLGTIKLRRTGHQYRIKYTKTLDNGELFTQYSFVYSKKQAIFVTDILKEGFPNIYDVKVNKIY